MTDLKLIGYFPQRVAHRPDWLKVPHVTAIRSAARCISKGPENWIEFWTHNKMWLYSTVSSAIAVVPELLRPEFELHAFRMLDELFDENETGRFPLALDDIEPLPSDFTSVGFDVVSIYRIQGCEPDGRPSLDSPWDGYEFQHSPLSCNSMAKKYSVNEHCLFDTLPEALSAARDFSRDEPEPGPYLVVEVCRSMTALR